MAEPWTAKHLDVKACTEVYSSTNNKGPYTIHDVKAANAEGVLINHKLSAFEPLPLGPGEYEIQPYKKGGVVQSYNVRKKGGGGGQSTAADVNFLSEQLQWAQSKINDLTTRVEVLESRVLNVASPAQAQTPVGPSATDDDIPFLRRDVEWGDRYEHGSRR